MNRIFIGLLFASISLKVSCQLGVLDYYRVAEENYNEKKYSAALEIYDTLFKLGTYTAEIYFKRGQIMYALRNDAEAISDYSRSLAIDSSNAFVYYHRALSYFYTKKIDSARFDLNNAVRLKSDFANPYVYLGAINFLNAKDADCIAYETKAIVIDSSNYLSYYYRAMAKRQMGNNKGVIEDFNKALSLKESYDYYYYRGIAKYNLKDYAGALNDQNKAINLKPDFANAYLERGMCYIIDSEDDKAIEDFTKCIELKPESAKAYHYRGVSRKYKDDLEGACMDLRKAQKMGYSKSTDELEKTNCN